MDHIKKYNEYLNDNFWKWFGDSKVVDKKGNPLIVYHGSGRNFTEFEPMKSSSDFPEAMYFSDSEKVAKSYSNFGVIPYRLYLKIEKPYIIDAKNRDFNSLYNEIVSGMHYAKDNYYDGLIFKNIIDDWEQKDFKQKSANTYVTFYPNQIKSATNNNGNFNIDNENINENNGSY
jgi:hypothetical protein